MMEVMFILMFDLFFVVVKDGMLELWNLVVEEVVVLEEFVNGFFEWLMKLLCMVFLIGVYYVLMGYDYVVMVYIGCDEWYYLLCILLIGDMFMGFGGVVMIL